MKLSDILNQVESPFTDEKIINLTKKFIECDCDMNKFYRSANIEPETQANPHLIELYSKLFSEENRGDRFVSLNDSWNVVASSEETLRVPDDREKRVPIYRIYLNAKGQDKARIVEQYIAFCEAEGRQYKLKYAVEDGRKDEILILSSSEDLVRNIELVEGITKGIELGEPAPLTGRYKGKIGIGEEYIDAPIYSYTKTRLGMISVAMKKFYLDHIEDFSEHIDDTHKQMAEMYIDEFKEESEDITCEIEEVIDMDEQEKRALENNKRAYSNNINPRINWMYDDYMPLYTPEAMRKYLCEHLPEAMPEIIENYRLACTIYGISKDGVLSTRTEEVIGQEREEKTFIDSIQVSDGEVTENLEKYNLENKSTKQSEKTVISRDDE